MRFTKIPLIATLMAVALSLLIVLPTIAQTTDITDGRQSAGGGLIAVGVFDDIDDAQKVKLVRSSFAFPADATPDPFPFVPVADPPTEGTLGQGANGSGVHTGGNNPDAAYLVNPVVDPQNTHFRNTLYVSNDKGAFNTILINVKNEDGIQETCVPNDTATSDVDEATFGTPRMTATVKNNRSGGNIEIQLVRAGADDFQAFVKVVDQGDKGTYDPDPNTDDDEEEVAFTQDGGPTWCDDERKTRHIDNDDDPATPVNNDDDTDGNPEADEPIAVQTEATSAVYGPVVHSVNDEPEAQQEIATIFAKHGDRLTITTSAGSGQIELVVDGDGPDFSAITPEDNTVSRPNRLTFSFEVRDDDSGLRHDGESVISPDDDYDEINPDGDQHLATEPLSVDPGTLVSSNGKAADIDVNVVANPSTGTGTDPLNEDTDISASGTWRMAGSRAGVAYSFSASGADRDDLPYLYQLRARDRAGNETVTDADDRLSGNQAFVFRVDDEEPNLVTARTGISYDTDPDDNKEIVDRSYIALEFTADNAPDALGDVDTDNITVVGHTIVGYIHPSKAPAINRNMGAPDRMDYEPTTVSYEAAEPATEQPSTSTDSDTRTALSTARTADPRDAAQNALLRLEGQWIQYNADNVDTAMAPTPPTTTEPSATECAATDDAVADDQDIQLCGQWIQYRLDKGRYDEGVTAEEEAAKTYEAALAKFKKDAAPGTDIEGEDFTDPRSRVYLELAEDLASDATPTVLVVGGAVYDLAGNTNDSKTLDEAEDWIAPTLTVTVTGTADDRPVASEDAEGSVTIDVRSDEDLSRRPKVFFVSLAAAVEKDKDDKVTGYEYSVDGREEANALTQQEDENHWAKTYKTNSADLSEFNDELVGVVVTGYDGDGNVGATDGWSKHEHRTSSSEDTAPNDDDSLDLEDMDDAVLLIEIDNQFNDGDEDDLGFVTPRSNEEGSETESTNPFVKLEFTSEGSEYEVCPVDGCHDDVDTEFKDSHGTVTVTEITLDGENVMAQLNRVDSDEFSLVTRDLEIGKHKVVYTAVDDAGNELEDGEFTFEVLEREPYEIDVSPGWNLISLPATPLEPAIGDVLANNQYISPVLGYQKGDWITAIREEDGTWRGRLETIDGGYGYWIHARTFESIETMLSEVDPAGTLPTVPVTAGWNLLGVLDIFQNDSGESPGKAGDNGDEADNYFSSIPWRVAYSYLTSHSLWVKAVPDTDTNVLEDGEIKTETVTDEDGNETTVNVYEAEIINGNGYWVWTPTPGVLVP